jgi:hypothetical protein
LLHNGYGQYGEALAAARQACEHEDVMYYGWALVELVEAGSATASLTKPQRRSAG